MDLIAQYHPRNKLQVFGYSGRLIAVSAWSIVEAHGQYIRNDVLFFFAPETWFEVVLYGEGKAGTESTAFEAEAVIDGTDWTDEIHYRRGRLHKMKNIYKTDGTMLVNGLALTGRLTAPTQRPGDKDAGRKPC